MVEVLDIAPHKNGEGGGEMVDKITLVVAFLNMIYGFIRPNRWLAIGWLVTCLCLIRIIWG